MATKLSTVTAKTDTNAADLVYLASTEDGGSSYSSKSITVANLFAAETAARTAAITAAIDALVDAAPGTLNTLNEIAAAINDDADVFTTLTTAIAAVQTDVDQNESDGDAGRTALAALITALTSTVAALDTKTVDGGDNVNTLVASTTPDTTPASFYFLAVDASSGAIKVVDKNFVEVE